MSEKTLSSLEKLRIQKEKIDVRIQRMEAFAKTAERKKDTRRKILIGSYYLDKARQHNQMDHLKETLDGYLKRNSDRKLFDLPEIAEPVN